MTQRYFIAPPVGSKHAVLTGPEAHHMIHVMRAKPGTRVVLFDGSGAEFTARADRVGRTEVELSVLSRRDIDRELPLEVTLGAPLPKGDRRRWLVEKATELGVFRLVPLVTERSAAQPGRPIVARLRRTVIEASKQCGRNRLLEIAEPQTWAEFVTGTRGVPCRWLAQPQEVVGRRQQAVGSRQEAAGRRQYAAGSTQQGVGSGQHADFQSSICNLRSSIGPKAVALAVGPEGGFTGAEVALAASAGWQSLDLGPRILRLETAAILLVGLAAQAAQRT